MNPAEAAETIRRLPIYTYNFIGNPAEQRCVGPMAQDWAGAFPSNKSPKHIEYNDVLGMTVAALQCCLDRIEKLEAQLKK
jgi:hypothetical protein